MIANVIACPSAVTAAVTASTLIDCADAANMPIIRGIRVYQPTGMHLSACKALERLMRLWANNPARAADLAFVTACYDMRNARPDDLPAAAAEMAELLEDALGVHIYSQEDGDLIPADDSHVASINRVRAAMGLDAADIEVTPVWAYSATCCAKGEQESYSTEVLADTAAEALERGRADLETVYRGASKVDGRVTLTAGEPR